MKSAFRVWVTAASAASLWASLWGCSTKADDGGGGKRQNDGCSSNAQCLNGHECSGGQCVPFTACPAVACPTGQSCVQGACRAACTSNAECGALVCNTAAGVCQPAPNPVGTGGASGVGGSPGVGGSLGAAGSPAADGVGIGGSAGSGTTGGSGGSGGGAPLECLTDPNLALDGGWIGCDPASTEDNPMGLQGSIYMYHDGSTCTSPVEACTATGCCIKGATVVDATFAKWGCGLGFELNSTGGDTPMKKAYAGPAKCFDIKLTGSSGGNPVRIAYTQSDAMDGKVAPFLELKPLTNGFTGTVCFNDVTCPTEWKPPPNCMLGGPYDLQIQVVGGNTAGAFDLCLTQLIPHESGGGQTTLGQICGIVGENDKEHLTAGPYRIQNNVATADSGKQCITAKAGGGAAGFTVDSSSLSTGGNSPVAYPSVAYGWHFGQSTTGTGLPKALSALASAPSTVTYTPPSGGKYNASYDIWAVPASAGANPATPAGGLEVMIWLAAGGGPQPIGSPGETVKIGNHNYEIWTGKNTTWDVVTFWSKDYIGGWTNEDLKPFLQKAIALGKAQNDWNLLSVQFGFEIWNGGNGASVTSFSQSIK
jgi:cellulose 1,4-beta-cellobiosidase